MASDGRLVRMTIRVKPIQHEKLLAEENAAALVRQLLDAHYNMGPTREFRFSWREPIHVGKALLEEARSMLNQRLYIGAIKLIRQRTGIGLKEAKDVVDQYRREEGL